MKKTFFKIIATFMFGIALGFFVGTKISGHRGRKGAECECVEWECEEKLDNILLKERN